MKPRIRPTVSWHGGWFECQGQGVAGYGPSPAQAYATWLKRKIKIEAHKKSLARRLAHWLKL